MATYICNDCGERVNRGDAHVRSVNFEQVAYCHNCWVAQHDGAAIPTPRSSTEWAGEVANR